PVIFDFHTHVLPDDFKNERSRFLRADPTFRALFSTPTARTASTTDLLAGMHEAGIDRAVILGYGWWDKGVARIANDYLLESAAKSNGRLVPFCSLNPRWGRGAVREAERCAAAGALGLGELHPDTQKIDISDADVMAPLMNAAEALGLIVTTHGSEPVGHSYPGKGTVTPERLFRLALHFPKVRFVFAHWGGGLPFYGLMPEVARAMRRVWFDSAATAFLYNPNVFRTVATAAGPDRILFGSDYPLISQQRAFRDACGASLSPKESEAMFSGNAVALLSGDGIE
ncbi:MAG: amidohydrolase, partial [Chloroflexi bacterium]|nr:amidohydrolase [Chloroflexota bacterium]